MKKTFFLSAALLSSLVLGAAETGVVNADVLKLRLQPGFKSAVAGKCIKDDEVKVLRVVGNWAELEVPAKLPVYVSEARILNGKSISELNLRTKPAASAPCLGVLPAGAEVKVLKREKYGWVRIAPPAGLKVYAAKMYLTFDEKKLEQETVPENSPAVEKKADPAAQKMEEKQTPPAVPEEKVSEQKPVTVAKVEEKKLEPAAKVEEKRAESAVQAPAKPVVSAVKVPAKPAAPVAQPAAPVAKAPVKPAAPVKTAAAEKIAIPPQANTPAKSAPGKVSEPVKDAAVAKTQPVPLPSVLSAAFAQLGINLKQSPEKITLKGVLTRLHFSQNPATDYALLEGKNGKNLAFVCAKDGVSLSSFEGKNVAVSGDAYKLPDGKVPVVLAVSLNEGN